MSQRPDPLEILIAVLILLVIVWETIKPIKREKRHGHHDR